MCNYKKKSLFVTLETLKKYAINILLRSCQLTRVSQLNIDNLSSDTDIKNLENELPKF